jgi:hypothetical protein
LPREPIRLRKIKWRDRPIWFSSAKRLTEPQWAPGKRAARLKFNKRFNVWQCESDGLKAAEGGRTVFFISMHELVEKWP